MIEKTHDINTTEAQDIETTSKERTPFQKKVVRFNALTRAFSKDEDCDIAKGEHECQNGLEALGAEGGLQEMLVAQMLSIHEHQQISLAMANKIYHHNTRQYLTNTAIKLANIFVQQAHLLNKLQGNGEQKIVVEHVEVHSGAQAVVGNINGSSQAGKVKK